MSKIDAERAAFEARHPSAREAREELEAAIDLEHARAEAGIPRGEPVGPNWMLPPAVHAARVDGPTQELERARADYARVAARIHTSEVLAFEAAYRNEARKVEFFQARPTPSTGRRETFEARSPVFRGSEQVWRGGREVLVA